MTRCACIQTSMWQQAVSSATDTVTAAQSMTQAHSSARVKGAHVHFAWAIIQRPIRYHRCKAWAQIAASLSSTLHTAADHVTTINAQK